MKWDTNRHGDYAGFKIRLCAFIIDHIYYISLAIFIMICFKSMTYIEIYKSNINITKISSLIKSDFYLIFSLCISLYSPIKTTSSDQATIGKKICKIHIVTMYGKRLTFIHSIKRFFWQSFTCYTMLFPINCILIAFTKKKMSLHDFITSTDVIYGTMPESKKGELD